MQAGSDGVQSCATCHFSVGADNRSRNQISPGLHDSNFSGAFISGDNHFGNSTVPYTAKDPHTPDPPGPSEPPPANLDMPGFPQFKPNHQLAAADFPLNGWLRPTARTPRGPHTSFLEEFANVSRDTNDVISSKGVRHTIFTGVTPGNPVDKGTPEKDIFNLAAPGEISTNKLVRRVEPRNAPTVINSVFNFDNFWDGRASFIFNGVNPFGFRHRLSTLKQVDNGALRDVYLRVTNSGLASQAVGPATSNFEMSFEHRTFPDIRQVVEFYTRGGNFPNTNFGDLDPDIEGIPGLRFPEFLPSSKRNIEDLVNFVSEGLTDQRVAQEKGPFDHPQLFVPNGTGDLTPGVDSFLEVQAVGRRGRSTSVGTFLNLDPQTP